MAKRREYGDQNGRNPQPGVLERARARREGRLAAGGRADYGTATAGWVLAAVCAVTSVGGALQFGYSRDGGVYTIVILMDGDMEKNYVTQTEGIDQFLEQLTNDYGRVDEGT